MCGDLKININIPTFYRLEIWTFQIIKTYSSFMKCNKCTLKMISMIFNLSVFNAWIVCEIWEGNYRKLQVYL